MDDDGRGVVLQVPDLVPCNQLRVSLGIKERGGENFDAEFYQTIHRLPGK